MGLHIEWAVDNKEPWLPSHHKGPDIPRCTLIGACAILTSQGQRWEYSEKKGCEGRRCHWREREVKLVDEYCHYLARKVLLVEPLQRTTPRTFSISLYNDEES